MNDGPVPDRLFDGRLRLHQAPRGHRAGTDAVLLAAAAAPAPGETFVDVGAGVGTVGLAIAQHRPDSRGTLVEIDPATADLARRNAALNGLSARIAISCVDLFDATGCKAAGLLGSASLVVSNPPFYRAGEVRASNDADRSRAHVLHPAGRGHGDWMRRCLALVGPKGRCLMIHRPEALPELLAACAGRLGGVILRAVHPRHDAPASRILLGGAVGERGGLTIIPPLVLHGPGGSFSDEAEAAHRGAALTFWPRKRPAPRGRPLVDSSGTPNAQ